MGDIENIYSDNSEENEELSFESDASDDLFDGENQEDDLSFEEEPEISDDIDDLIHVHCFDITYLGR